MHAAGDSHDGSSSDTARTYSVQSRATKRHRRLRLLVLPALQLRLIGYQFMAATIFALVLVAAMVGPDIGVLLTEGHPEEEVLASADRMITIDDVVWPSLALGLLFLLGTTTIVSHRIAGPLYRLRCVLNQLRNGRIAARVRLRERDFLHEEAQVLEEALGGLRSMLGGVIAAHTELASALEAAREGARLGAALREEDLERLLATAATVDEHLRAFEIEPASGHLPT